MTRPTLRLVVGSPDEADQHVELPMSGPSTLHVHLHLGAAPASLAPPPPLDVVGKSGQSEKGWGRTSLLACAACVLALVSYGVGTHNGGGSAPVARPLPASPQDCLHHTQPGRAAARRSRAAGVAAGAHAPAGRAGCGRSRQSVRLASLIGR